MSGSATGLSARGRPERATLIGILVLLALLAAALAVTGSAYGFVIWGPAFGLLTLLGGVRLIALARLMWGVWGDVKPPPVSDPTARTWDLELPIYSIIAPVYGEAEVIDDLVGAVRMLDYPAERLDLIIATETDDDATTEAARRATRDLPNARVVVTPPGEPKTKGRASNHALARAKGRFVVVFDAEDRPEPDQLRKAVCAFAEGGEELVCLQARLVIDNGAESLLARMMESEYAAHFKAFLPMLASWRWPLPLSGSSNHFRTDVLRRLGGWDAWNVTEDADLGFRLARAGRRAQLLDSRTYEECPSRVGPWLRQRARWMKGFLQTACAHWARPGRFLAEAGLRGWAAITVAVAGGVAATLSFWAMTFGPIIGHLAGRAPSSAAIWALGGLSVTGATVAMATAACATPVRDLRIRLALALFALPYWVLLASAALLAVRDAFVAPHHWRKTPHGSHRRGLETRAGD